MVQIIRVITVYISFIIIYPAVIGGLIRAHLNFFLQRMEEINGLGVDLTAACLITVLQECIMTPFLLLRREEEECVAYCQIFKIGRTYTKIEHTSSLRNHALLLYKYMNQHG